MWNTGKEEHAVRKVSNDMLAWGRVRSELCFKDPARFHELAPRSWIGDCDDDKYMLLVRLITVGWVGAAGPGSLLVCLVLVRRRGPTSDAEVH